MKRLPVNGNLFLVIGNQQIPANKKALSGFLKAEKIKWNDPQDLVKVIDFVTAE